MNCMTQLLQPMTMATTQLRCAFHADYIRQVEPRAEHTPLRMSWVVVTDERGRRQLRMRWFTTENEL
jgi:hypothetical protein